MNRQKEENQQYKLSYSDLECKITQHGRQATGNGRTIIKWDIIGLSEVRRKDEGLVELKSGKLLLY